MPLRPQEFRQFRGLTPAIDRRRIDAPAVVDGANFFVDIDGPVSGMATTWIFNAELRDPRFSQFLLDEHDKATIVSGVDGLYKYDLDTRVLYPIYQHALRTSFRPWGQARCGNFIYFCNIDIGLIEWNYTTGEWKTLSGGSFPSVMVDCCNVGGRLVILGETVVLWSEIDNGDNVVPDTDLGVGFQVLSFISPGATALRVLPCATGVLVYTSAGIMRGSLTTNINPFRWDILSRDHKLVNAVAIARVGEVDREKHVFITHRGLFSTFGETRPEVWEPIFSEFIHNQIMPSIDHDDNEATLKLSHDFSVGFVVLSVSLDSREGIYTRAYVMHLTTREWGVFNRDHCDFGGCEFVQHIALTGPSICVIDSEGSTHVLSFTDTQRVYPSAEDRPYFIDYHEPFDIPAQFNGLTGVSDMPCMFVMNDEDISQLENAGVYDLQFAYRTVVSPTDDDLDTVAETPDESGTPVIMFDEMRMQDEAIRFVVKPIPYDSDPLDAWILVGPFRAVESTDIDSLIEINECSIGMLDSGVADEYVDHLLDFPLEVIEDWLTESGDEDWGEAAAGATNYTVEYISTLDGYNEWVIDGEPQSMTPELVATEGRTRFYAGSCTGLYNYIRISAFEIGEVFHLKQLRVNSLIAGQLH